jgi:hypothetical protein
VHHHRDIILRNEERNPRNFDTKLLSITEPRI